MKLCYLVAVCIMLVIMLVMAQKTKEKKTDTAKALRRLTYVVVVSVVSCVLALFVPSDEMALFLVTIHYIATEWIILFFLAFFERYTGIVQKKKIYRLLVFAACTISMVVCLLNCVFHNVVSCSTKVIDGESYRVFHYIYPGYAVHQGLSYLMGTCLVIYWIYVTAKTIRFYRVRYYPAIAAVIVTMLLEVICDFTQVVMDYALFGYLWLAIFVIYHAVFRVYKSLINKTLSYVASDSQSGVVCFNLSGDCIYANDVAWRFFTEVNALEDFETALAQYANDVTDTDATSKQLIVRKNGNENRYVELTYGLLDDKYGDVIGSYYYLYDKTEDVREYEEANFKATHDSLTKLLNGEQFNIQVKERISKADDNNQGSYIVAADIKDFKLINDLYGFEKGNEILRAFAKACVDEFSENAVCSRLNSDRFVLYIPGEEFSEENLLSCVNKVSDRFSESQIQLIFHFGICEVTNSETPVNVLYDYARIALLLIKGEYDKTFSYYDEKMMKQIVREKELVGEFDRALEEKQFIMYLQPQVTADGRVIGAEALARWNHPEKGMISPGEFISVFEHASLIHRLDRYMWELAAHKIREWKDTGKENYYISVNISPRDFYYLDVYQTLVDIVEENGISPSSLKLEITESAFMRDPETQLELIARLQDYGFHVEIDDFGSGYSSLNMLKDMKADVLKIDMGFLRKSSDSERAQTILDIIIELAGKLKMVVVTEGVESEEQVKYLANIGCDIFQGYYFDKPINVTEFEQKYMGEARE